MFKNLEMEITKKGFTRKELAGKVGISTSTLYKKMTGELEFRLKDIQKIMKTIKTERTADYLFCQN